MSQKNYRILILDDDTAFHRLLRQAYRREFLFDGVLDAERLFSKLAAGGETYDLLLLNPSLNRSGRRTRLDLLARLHRQYPGLPVVVATAPCGIDTVVEAMRLGARDFLLKTDFEPGRWQQKLLAAMQPAASAEERPPAGTRAGTRPAQPAANCSFIGESEGIREIKRLLRLVSEEPDVTVLITGETGTGKEVAARYLHDHGARRNRPFQAVNLSAIQDTLLESTLFGHRKGAFTGATRDTEGYFNQADGGVLLLDEIGDIDANIQVKLLRFLETKLIRPVGADRDQRLDLQVVAATHRDLGRAVQQGRFRDDLYQRLKAMVIELPPLRYRREDVPLLLQHYLATERLSDALVPAALERLLHYDWPGNVRELKNAVSYMQLRRKIRGADRIDLPCLPPELRQDQPAALFAVSLSGNGRHRNREEEKALIDLEQIEKLLVTKNRVKKDVAAAMGLDNTDNLRYCVRKHFERHPHLFDNFPAIRQSYRRIVR